MYFSWFSDGNNCSLRMDKRAQSKYSFWV